MPATEDGDTSTFAVRRDEALEPGTTAPDRRDVGSSTEDGGLAREITTSPPKLISQQDQQRLQQRVCPATTETAGKCLIVCPTGADASIVVCLSALVAFFPPKRTTPCCSNACVDEIKVPSQNKTSGLTTGEAEIGEEDAGQHFGGGRFAVLRRHAGVVTKAQVRWRYILLQQECPWARPPRRMMQELNEYFMSPREPSWWNLSDQLTEEAGLRDR